MEENRLSSFKRHCDPYSEKDDAKRAKFGDQSSETVYKILCPRKKIGNVIGKGGVIVKALREETQAKIAVADPIPGSEDRLIIVHSFSTKKPVKHNSEDMDMELQCAAQDALLKIHNRIVEEDITNNETVVTARLLVPSNKVGCLLGKKGDVIKRLRSETGASIQIMPANELHVCARHTDELVQISAKPGIAKRALYEVSTLLHQNPRQDKPPSGFPVTVGPHPPGPPMWSEPPIRWSGEYFSERSRFGPPDFDDDRAVSETRAEFSMKILCPTSKIGGVIGKGGSNVKQLEQETGTSIHIDDVSEDSKERVICVSSFEALLNPRSQTIDAILVLQDKTSDDSDEKGTLTTRLLIPSSKVGCILGQGGQIINEMRWKTKADIRVYSKEEKPKCAGVDEELVQISGSYGTVKDALAEIALRYRERCLRDATPAPTFSSRGHLSPVERGDRSHGYEAFKGVGREYEPLRYRAPSRDYEPYSYSLAPPRDYEPYRHPVPERDYEFRDYPPSSRDYEPYSYPDLPVDYEPFGYSGLKMLSSRDRGSAIDNASEIMRARPRLQDLYGGGSQLLLSPAHRDYSGQKRSLQSSYRDNYTDVIATHTDSRHDYQSNPTQQGHYSQASYRYQY